MDAVDYFDNGPWGVHRAEWVSAKIIGERQSDLSLTVDIAAFDTRYIHLFCEAVKRARIRLEVGGSLRIVLANDYLRAELADINEWAIANARPWLLAGVIGAQQWLGPLFLPGKTACWMCLARRLSDNCPRTKRRSTPHAWQSIARRLAFTLDNLTLTAESPLAGTLYIRDSGHLSEHRVVPRPNCPACGSACVRIPAPLDLSSVSPKRFSRLLEEHVGDVTGIVSSPQRMLARRRLSAYAAYLSGQVHRERSGKLFRTLRGEVFAAAPDARTARLACLAEAVERYSILYHGDEATTTASFGELRGNALHPADLLLFSERQYRLRGARNEKHGGFQWIPKRLNKNARVEWTEVTGLTDGKRYYVPSAYCYMGYGAEFCRGDSNGCAAGVSLADALVRGFLELVERDAFAIWWYNRVQRPAVPPDRSWPAAARAVVEYLASAGRRVHVIDVTSDLGIPVFVAVSANAAGRRVMIGSGSHLDPRLALQKALLELLQTDANSRLRTNPKTQLRPLSRAVMAWLQTASLHEHRYLVPAERSGCGLSDFASQFREDARQDLDTCLDIARRHGLRVLALNMTRPEIGVPVARVIVPGLRHFWARFAPGRLYDVPVKLRWLDRPLRESELNPVPFFL